METLITSLFSAAMLASIALVVGFSVYRISRWRGQLPSRSFGALYFLLLLAAWAATVRLRPEGHFLKEGYWVPLAGILLLAAAGWLSAALSRSTAPSSGAAARKWGLPIPVGIYWTILAAFATSRLDRAYEEALYRFYDTPIEA